MISLGVYGSRALLRKQSSQSAESAALKQASQLAIVVRTIDLYNRGTSRGGGEPNPLEAVSLPSALVHLRLILPRFSDPGNYVVAVSKDKAATAIAARGTGKTVADGQRLFLEVPLDLRGATAGSYFLATVRESDKGNLLLSGKCAGALTMQAFCSAAFPASLSSRSDYRTNAQPQIGTSFAMLDSFWTVGSTTILDR